MTTGADPDYATIGGILLDPSQLDAVSGWLRPGDFARPLCGELYQLLTTMRVSSTPIDPVTVLGELRRRGRLRDDGYPGGELIAMIEAVPLAASTPYYARQVLEASTFRRIEMFGVRATQVGRGHRGTADEALDAVAESWRQLADAGERWQHSSPSGTGAPAVIRPQQLEPPERRDDPAVARAR